MIICSTRASAFTDRQPFQDFVVFLLNVMAKKGRFTPHPFLISMKKFLLVAFLFQGLAFPSLAQQAQTAGKALSFGKKITDKNAITTTELLTRIKGKDALPAKVTGEIESVCQAKGCWAKVKLPDGQRMRVTFKDYAFFVPKDAAGKKIIMDGTAFVKIVPVEEQRHYAKDAGATEEEQAKINQPEQALTFEAKGVLIK